MVGDEDNVVAGKTAGGIALPPSATAATDAALAAADETLANRGALADVAT